MKLRELAIEGLGTQQPVNLGRFNDGLSIIYGETSVGKSRLCRFVRNTLVGHLAPAVTPNNGSLTFNRGLDEFQVSRDLNTQALNTRHLNASARNSLSPSYLDERQLLGELSSEAYDTIYNFSLKDTLSNSNRLATVLRTQLGVPTGPQAAGDNSAHLAWEREAKEIRVRLESIETLSASLTNEKANKYSQIETSRASVRARIVELEREINLILPRLNDLQTNTLNEQLVAVEREISQLRLLIENAKTRVAHIPPAPQIDQHAALYQRLDEIDNQIRRWRHVQTDIQSQRVRLRDEMIVWNELTLDSDDHPYHTAREILVALESKVDQAERQANHWSGAVGERVDATQLAESLRSLCKNMRDDVYGLCNELAQQYKHIRHRAAAAELKQLRRCYNEMGESINRLIERRNQALKEIAKIDPAGADAIVRADLKFCQCAHHEGYLEARRRFVGTIAKSAPIQPTYEVVTPNLESERAQLANLEQQRANLLAQISNVESELRNLNLRHTELVRERDSIGLPEWKDLELRLQSIEIELQELVSEQTTLLRRLESPRVALPPNALLLQAGEVLSRISNGDLVQVFLGENVSTEINLRDRFGKVLNISAVEPALQDQAYLSLVLAAREQLAGQGIELPTIIDDAFSRIDSDRVTTTLSMLNEFGNRGHQLVATTQHRYLADRVPGVPLFELAAPMTTSTPTTFVPEPAWSATNVETNDNFYTSSQPRSYPLTKYPRSKPDYGQEDRGYTITYPFAQQNAESAKFEREMYGAPITAGQPGKVTSVRASRVAAEQVEFAPAIDDNTQLDKVACFDASQLRIFDQYGLLTVGDLLSLDPQHADQFGFRVDQIDQWQALVWLMSNVPGMRIYDAQILVACGVTEPEQLDTSHAQQLYERIQRFLSSSEGRRFSSNSESISLDRIGGWHRGINRTRSRWSNRSRSSRRSRTPRTGYSQSRSSTQRTPRESQPYVRQEREPRSYREREPRERTREAREPRAPRMNTMREEREPRDYDSKRRSDRPERTAERPAARLTASEKPKAKRVTRSKSSTISTDKQKLKFYLDLTDHIEAAPSIGPKTAERFEKIGVHTVAEFLKQTAESMASKINYKRLNATVIRQWQQQARLICRVPNLRGHDAQLLVSCGITEPEELSTMQPANLFDVIGPFSETKEGLKIIRNGKKPDLEEITDWISWAEHTRSLKAA